MAEGALGKKSGAVVASAQEQDALQPRHSWQASAGTPQASIKPKDLSASSQQNRFHVADTAARNQLIDIKGVNLSIGHKDLLQETHVQLQAGVCAPRHMNKFVACATLFRAVEHPSMHSEPRLAPATRKVS